MAIHLERVQRACDERRTRAFVAPARVWPPVAVGAALQLAAAVAGLSLGLSVTVVLAVDVVIGVLVAVVARRTVSSLVAGAGLRVVRPYLPGEHVRVYVPALRSVQDAEIVRVGPANTALMTHDGLVLVPNSVMLRGAPQRRSGLDRAA